MGPGALDQKTKVLITLALDAAHGAREGVVSLAGQARSLGASDAEIAEAIRIAYFVAGNSVLAAAGAAFAK
jgi:alkylhydroperoxidase/carboxymuconolactone decarboxylase family protein YurZ